jgi:hypothetical protein
MVPTAGKSGGSAVRPARSARPGEGEYTRSVLGYLPSLNVHDGFSLESKVRDLDLQWSREGSGLFFFFFELSAAYLVRKALFGTSVFERTRKNARTLHRDEKGLRIYLILRHGSTTDDRLR